MAYYLRKARLATQALGLVATLPTVSISTTPWSQPAAAISSMCSLNPLPLWRDSATTFLVATALPDTVLAGLGSVTPSMGAGHWGAGAPRPVYGQVVRVDTLRGWQEDRVRDGMRRTAAHEVILVPW